MEEGGLVLEDLLDSVLNPDTTLVSSFLNNNTTRCGTFTLRQTKVNSNLICFQSFYFEDVLSLNVLNV